MPWGSGSCRLVFPALTCCVHSAFSPPLGLHCCNPTYPTPSSYELQHIRPSPRPQHTVHLSSSQFMVIEGTRNTSLERVGIFTQKAVGFQQGQSYHIGADDKIFYILTKRVAGVRIADTHTATHWEDERLSGAGRAETIQPTTPGWPRPTRWVTFCDKSAGLR